MTISNDLIRKAHKDFFLKIFMVFGFIFMFATEMVAQNLEIKGIVLDSKTNGPLPGVNVVVESTTNGTTTDFEGRYRITVPSIKTSLQFSFIGYITQTVPVTGKWDINILFAE